MADRKDKFTTKGTSIMLGDMCVFSNVSLNNSTIGSLTSLMNVAYLMGYNEHAMKCEERAMTEGKI